MNCRRCCGVCKPPYHCCWQREWLIDATSCTFSCRSTWRGYRRSPDSAVTQNLLLKGWGRQTLECHMGHGHIWASSPLFPIFQGLTSPNASIQSPVRPLKATANSHDTKTVSSNLKRRDVIRSWPASGPNTGSHRSLTLLANFGISASDLKHLFLRA